MAQQDKPPLGPRVVEAGTELSVFAPNADAVELCLFDESGSETARVEAHGVAGYHRAVIREAEFGQRYGWRAHGPYDPSRGLLFDASKLLLDPSARAVAGEVEWHPSLWSEQVVAPAADSAPYVPRSVLVDTSFEWEGDVRPNVPWDETIIYEVHVKGLTKLHPAVPQELRGTYAGLGSAEVIDHLIRLGVTTVELLPIAWFLHDQRLVEKGLRNYWGYQPMVFTAPYPGYAFDARDGGVRELKAMIKTLHSAGIEVILDVVFNHTGEDGNGGPTLCYRGLDNATYYLHESENLRADYTGCGNTLKVNEPGVLGLILDSLRYWAEEFHVDGFRFDLATTLGRAPHEFDEGAPFFKAIESNPVLRELKLIAEPWDLGPRGYQLGKFPHGWAEWNDRYRDGIRDFWIGRGRLPEYVPPAVEYPTRPVNFVTAHDGFTLVDLVSYERKHNAANGDGNRDGQDDNHSWNHGQEGPSDNQEVNELRARQVRNFLTSLLIYPGVPMLLAGDELGRTQLGNNNAYCQDNETSWIDWGGGATEDREWIRRMVDLRRALHLGEPDYEQLDISWLNAEGRPMEHVWHPGEGAFGFSVGPPSGPRHLFAMNPSPSAQTFLLPAGAWRLVADTANPAAVREVEPEEAVVLENRSMQIWAAV